MTDCVFCRIIKKEIPTEIEFEDENLIVFKDIHPKTEIHFLIVPKKHIASIKTLAEIDKNLAAEILLIAKKMGEKSKLSGYRLIFNVGRKGGQIVDHLHLHFLGGKNLRGF